MGQRINWLADSKWCQQTLNSKLSCLKLSMFGLFWNKTIHDRDNSHDTPANFFISHEK